MSNHKGNYSVTEGDIIFLEGSEIQSLNILVKGEIDIFLSHDNEHNNDESNDLNKSYRIFSIDKNIFIGTIGLFLEGKYPFSFHATKDSSLFAYPMNNIKQFSELLHSQKDYAALTIMSICIMMEHSYDALLGIEKQMEKLSILADNLSLLFWDLKKKYNLQQR